MRASQDCIREQTLVLVQTSTSVVREAVNSLDSTVLIQSSSRCSQWIIDGVDMSNPMYWHLVYLYFEKCQYVDKVYDLFIFIFGSVNFVINSSVYICRMIR